ncbi:hypothetical protein HYT92_00060 [Candidatus Pacearchaeota archaeon]|nr:hypothetical protein [Candidatus Pacearchaeota archaeon]
MTGRRTDDGAPVQADRDVEAFLKRKRVRLILSIWFKKANENRMEFSDNSAGLAGARGTMRNDAYFQRHES